MITKLDQAAPLRRPIIRDAKIYAVPTIAGPQTDLRIGGRDPWEVRTRAILGLAPELNPGREFMELMPQGGLVQAAALAPSLASMEQLSSAFLEIQTCPFQATFPVLDMIIATGGTRVPLAGGISHWAYGDQRHVGFDTRQIWLGNRGAGVIAAISSIDNTFVQLVDFRSGVSETLNNTWCLWDSKNDQIVLCNQGGRFYWVNPTTYAILNPTSPVIPSNGAPPGSPPDHGFCYDSKRGQVLVGYAVAGTGAFCIIDCGSMSEVSAFGMASPNDWGGRQYNPILDQYIVGHTTGTGGNFPFTYMDPVAHTIVNSALTHGPAGALFFLPEIGMLLYCNGSDGTVYLVDGHSAPAGLGGSGEVENQVMKSVADGGGPLQVAFAESVNSAGYDYCTNSIVISDSNNMWQIDLSTFISTRMTIGGLSIGGNLGVWFDKYSNYIFAADYGESYIKTY